MALAKRQAKIGFLLSFAVKNFFHHKKHMFMLIFGFSITLSIILGINTWAVTAKNLAVNDFLEKQDFQAYLFSSQNPEDINLVQASLAKNQLVSLYTSAYTSQALFNTENKPSSYVCLPEDEQNQTDPVSVTNVFIINQTILAQMSFLFDVEGNFTLEENSILVSWQQAKELEKIYHQAITPGTIVNISIAKKIPNPAYGQNQLQSFQLTNFINLTISGIYTTREVVSAIETAVKVDWLADSVIFPLKKMNGSDREAMAKNGIPYLLFVKFDREALTRNGFEDITETMNLFAEQIKKDYPAMFIYLFTSPIETLLAAYTRASQSLIFILPVMLVSSIVMVLTINVSIKARRKEVALLRDRGADSFQIILLFLVEFVLATFLGALLGGMFAFIIAATIPMVTNGGFTGEIFRLFITRMKISYSFFSGTLIITSVSLISYAFLKLWWEISLEQERKTAINDKQNNRKKIAKKIFQGFVISGTIIVSIAMIIAVREIMPTIREEQNYGVEKALLAGYNFTMATALLMAVAFFAAQALTEGFFPKMKGLYKRLWMTKAFFLSNNLRRKSKRLSQITLAIVLSTAVLTFAISTAKSIAQQQENERLFKNGADMRIVTTPIEHSFKENISKIVEINEVMPVFKTKGSIAYNDYTIYGVDARIYARVGKWEKSSSATPAESSTTNLLYALAETPEGIIISQKLAEKLNLTAGDNLPITNLPGGIYSRRFRIVGTINSAPGLGLAEGRNLELLQPYEGFVIINENYCRSELGMKTVQLFLASIFPGENIKNAEEKLMTFEPIITVNPEKLNEEFIGAFITNYVPKAQAFFIIAIGIIAVITSITIISFTDFTLKQRTKERAIKKALGETKKEQARMMQAEMIIITTSAAIIGIIIGILFSYGTFYLIVPIITAQSIIPYKLIIPVAQVSILIGTTIAIGIVACQPTIRRERKEKIIKQLSET